MQLAYFRDIPYLLAIFCVSLGKSRRRAWKMQFAAETCGLQALEGAVVEVRVREEEVAHLHGFESGAALLKASTPLPLLDGRQWFIALDPSGYWFVWSRGRASEEPSVRDDLS